MIRLFDVETKFRILNSIPDTSCTNLIFRKGRGTRDQIANISWIMEKAREFQKSIYLCRVHHEKWWAG